MTKKNDLNRGTNIESYRKRIGKQDYQKSKSEIKHIKRTAEAKQSAMSIKDVALVVATLAFGLAALYAVIYVYFQLE